MSTHKAISARLVQAIHEGVGLARFEGQTTASLHHRACAGAALLGVPLVETVLAP
ncbi:MAG: hypothetical protein HUU38_21130 [Anaerolineales bacterium]|nr:hypothetical protein [Anaerolineales bacterium]